MAASGIAANPVNNVGQYAEGGIVGFKNRGLMKDYQDSQILQRIGVAEATVANNPGDAEAQAYLDTLKKEQQMIGQYAEGGIVGFKKRGFVGSIYDYGKKKILGQKGQDKIISPGGTTPYKEAIPNILSRNPKKSIVGGGAGAYFIFGPDGEKTPISDEEANKLNGGTYNPPANITKDTKSDFDGLGYAREQKSLFDELAGDNTGLEKIKEKLSKKEENLLSDFFINVGLNTAIGKDANALTNLAAGVGEGYTNMQKSEKDILSGQLQLAKGERAEDIAGASSAIGGLEKEKTRLSDIEKAKIMSTVQGYNAPVKVGKMLMKAYQDSQILQRIGIAEAAVAKNPGNAEAQAYLESVKKEQQMIDKTVYETAGYTYTPTRTAMSPATGGAPLPDGLQEILNQY
tara:strand:- start:7923 stop:9128 length:1206 start_codon:yes stop_codon:yes gene_type:complete